MNKKEIVCEMSTWANSIKGCNADTFKKNKKFIESWITDDMAKAWNDNDPEYKIYIVKAIADIEGISKSKSDAIRRMFNWLYKLKRPTALSLDKKELIPTPELVKKYVNKYCPKDKPKYIDVPYEYDVKYRHYQDDFQVVDYLIDKLGNDNSYNAVSIKARVLNDLYATRISDIYPVVRAIVEANDFTSSLLNAKSLEDQEKMVNLIRYAPGANDNYSFATKYCHIHNHDFVIYDKFAAGMVIYLHMRYLNIDNTKAEFKSDVDMIIDCPGGRYNVDELKKALLSYSTYKKAIDNIQKVYRLGPDSTCAFSCDQIDKYLWGFGREYDISVDTVEQILKSNGIMDI